MRAFSRATLGMVAILLAIGLADAGFAVEPLSEAELGGFYGGLGWCDRDCVNGSIGCPLVVDREGVGCLGLGGQDCSICPGRYNKYCGPWHTQLIPPITCTMWYETCPADGIPGTCISGDCVPDGSSPGEPCNGRVFLNCSG